MACLDGQGGFDWGGLAALKTHVSLREALEIEAVKCVAGDSRHEFQGFYQKWLSEHRDRGSNSAVLGHLDAARVLEELEMTRQAIAEHEAMLVEHRNAVVCKQPSPYSDTDVDGLYAVLESLRANLPLIEAEYVRLIEGLDPADRRKLPDLAAIGPVQGGTMRPFEGGR